MSRSRRARSVLRRELSLLSLGVALAGFGVTAWNGASVIVHEAAGMLGAASVSISASVPMNADNALAQALAQKSAALDAREAGLSVRAPAERVSSETVVPWGLLSFLMSLALFALVAANFYLDMRRDGRRLIASPFAVDLRRR